MSDDARPALRVGERLGAYEIVRPLGAGGMGEVYEARDARLGRAVALKVVRREVANDPMRRGRLEREARAAATLRHPNVVTVHSLEECDGTLCLTMELIAGTTLREAIPTDGFAAGEFLRLAIQLTDGLAAAHQAGVIHRDLKPANVMLTDDGVLKIVDFGLSKWEIGRTVATTATDTLSSDGSLLGTAPYMAPEVIERGEADTRSDIFSLGIVLFEMATGSRPFIGETPLAVMSAILRDEPPLASDVRPAVPHAVAALIARCLVKRPAARRQSVADLSADFAALERGRTTGAPAATLPTAPASTPPPRRLWQRLAGATTASVALLIAGAGLRDFAAVPPAPPDRRQVQFSIDLPAAACPAGFNSCVAISRDGTHVAYTPLGGALTLRRIDGLEPRKLEGAEDPGFSRAPMFSPDGTALAFIEGDAIYSAKRQFQRAAISGGAATTLFDYDMFHSGDWADDGWIYWTARYPGGIVRIRDTGGTVEEVTTLDAQKQERSHRFAHLLPDGRSLIYTVASGGIETYDDARIELFDLATRTTKPLLTGGTSAVYAPSGHLVFARAGKLLAVPFDVASREVTGSPVAVLDGVLMSSNTGAANFAISRRGDLAYIPGASEGGRRTLVWVDRDGREEPLPLPPASYLYPRLSPDGQVLAVEIEGPNHDFHVYDLRRGVLSKMTTDGESHAPVWSPDGRTLAFRSWLAGGMTLWRMPADRSGPATRLHPSGTRESPVSFSPDGRFLAFDAKDPDSSDDAWALPIDGGGDPIAIARTRFGEGSAKFSPDGRWIAYSSDESGRPQVYVQAFPGPGPKLQVSRDGGIDPVWRRDGGELYYRSSGGMYAVRYRADDRFRAEAPALLWKGEYSAGNGASCGMPGVSSSNYDVTPDGRRFLMVKEPAADVVGTKVVVVLNWTDGLATRAPAGGRREARR